MGIKLGDLVVKRDLAEGELSGKTIGIDAYNVLYQFVASIRTPEGFPLTNSNGVVVSHLKGIFSRSGNLISEGIIPVYIFDGKPHELKKGTLAHRRERKERAQIQWDQALEMGDLEKARTKAQQTSKLTDSMVEDSKKLLDLMGIQWIQAPGEGEAQASYMAEKGLVHCASSQDFDTLLFGCPLLVRNLAFSGKRKMPGRRAWVNVEPEIIELAATLGHIGLTREQLVDMAILMGTDFNEGVKGIGPKTALKLIREFDDLETVVKQKRIPLLEWEEVRSIFLEPEVTDDIEIRSGRMDEKQLIEFLVKEMEFGRQGVDKMLSQIGSVNQEPSQTSLDSFF